MNESPLAEEQPFLIASTDGELAGVFPEDSPEPAVHWGRTSAHAERRVRELVDAHFALIWRVLRGLGVPAHSVDDAAQHVFWIASQKIESIAAGSERAFLFSTARLVSANAHRCRARNREVLGDEALDTQIDDHPNAEELVEMQEERAWLDGVLASMPEDLRTVFILYVLEGMTAPAISELLELALGTVASRLRRAREAFHAISNRMQKRAAHGKGDVP
jgi:RNA polymerase sigma-70 factor (ECF subfamily)